MTVCKMSGKIKISHHQGMNAPQKCLTFGVHIIWAGLPFVFRCLLLCNTKEKKRGLFGKHNSGDTVLGFHRGGGVEGGEDLGGVIRF